VKHTHPVVDPEKLYVEIAKLGNASVDELNQYWRSLYATEPPPRIGRELLTRAIAYRLQERVYGGLKPATRRFLMRIADDASARRSISAKPVRKVSAGAVLIREWQGATHQVTVLDDGVVHRGKRYRSLSEVARLITGCRWSGPAFFGIRTRAKEAVNGTR
jgi:hypothetical protein